MSAAVIDDVLDTLAGINTQDLRWQIKQFRAIRDWAVKQACDFDAGDRVEIQPSLHIASDSGWWHYREALAPGATATVTAIDFNSHYGYWAADIILDREWSVSTFQGETRYWDGPASETPAGYKPPSNFDQEKYPDGRKHTFAMPVKHLRRSDAAA